MTMRRSPRRPLILRRRKLPFQQKDWLAAEPQPVASGPKEPTKPETSQCFPDGVRSIDHPTMSDTRVVFIPKTADLQSVIQVLTDKGKECGAQGRNKFMLLCENGSDDNRSCYHSMNDSSTATTTGQPVKAELVNNSPDVLPYTAIKPFNDLKCDLLDNSLTDIQWLGKMSVCDFKPHPAKQMGSKKNQNPDSLNFQTQGTTEAESAQHPMSKRPPYSYMVMIQFAINSKKSRRMTLKEIYAWIEDHFPYFREVAKPGWKNSIRHNLSLNDMFTRESSPGGKVSFWTIRPEVNRCLTLDQVNRQRKTPQDARKKSPSSEKRMEPFLLRTKSDLIPVQTPVTSSVFILSPQVQFPPSCSQPEQTPSRGAKRVRIAPKVSQSDVLPSAMYALGSKQPKMKIKEEPILFKCKTPKSLTKRQSSSSRRKQHLVNSRNEEPILLCSENTFFDSDFIPLHTPGGPAVTPLHYYNAFSLSSTPVKDLPLFSSPRELLKSGRFRGIDITGSPIVSLQSGCSRELLQAGDSTTTILSSTKDLDQDTMNESLGKVLVDLSFPCIDDEDLNISTISLSEILCLIK